MKTLQPPETKDTLIFVSRTEEHYRNADGERYVVPVKVQRKQQRKDRKR